MEKRVIKFRGKRVDNNEWIYGDLIHWGKNIEISSDGEPLTRTVIPETVGEFTGIIDKNGKEIFEGDIISQYITRIPTHVPNEYEVEFKNAGFSLIDAKRNGDKYGVFTRNFPVQGDEYKVIGNVFENPNGFAEAGGKN